MSSFIIGSGLVKLVRDVREYFVNNDVGAEVRLGWRERTKQINQGADRANRVVFIPSDVGGRGGAITAARYLGDNPRAIRDWNRLVTVSVWAADSTQLSDEEAQIEVAEDLVEWTFRAVQNSPGGAANVEWGDTTWTVNPVELKFGVEVLIAMTLRHPLFDPYAEITFPDGNVRREPPE